jgi:hypothetical protein
VATRELPEGRLLQPRGAATLERSALLAQLVEHLHGKEGVSGSSPEEGSASDSLPASREQIASVRRRVPEEFGCRFPAHGVLGA